MAVRFGVFRIDFKRETRSPKRLVEFLQAEKRHGTVVMDDPKQPGGLRVTTVYQKHPQGWQMIAAHMSPAPTEQ